MPFLRALLLSLCLAAPCFAADLPTRPEPKANITVLVDPDMMITAAALARAFAQVSPTPLTIVVKNPEEVENEIEQGLEAHVLLTANGDLVTRLAEQGLTDVSSTRNVASTPLALVASRSLDAQELLARHISFAAMINATPNVPVFMELPGSISGNRADRLLKGFEFSPQLAQRAQTKPSQEAVLAALAQTPGLGLLPLPTALAQPDVLLLTPLSEALCEPIRFQSVVLASESMEDARQFTDFLFSPVAQAIFIRYGYQPMARTN